MKNNKTKNVNNSPLVVDKIKITHPNKIVFADCNVSKIQLIKYYKTVQKRMFKFVNNRFLSAVRCHNGLSCFYKKHPTTNCVGVKSKRVAGKTNMDEYFYISSPAGIIAQAQLGTVEFHCWASKVDSLSKPDIMVFDLDPDENVSLEQLRVGVMDVKKLLDSLHLKSFLKTSGGKGYHIVVPFLESVSWQKFTDFAKNVAITLEQKYPDRYTSNIRKSNRKNKIFIDWERNTRAQTSVAPYSLRARPGAKISMPIFWRDLNKFSPNYFDIFNAADYIKKNPWANFFKVKQKLK